MDNAMRAVSLDSRARKPGAMQPTRLNLRTNFGDVISGAESSEKELMTAFACGSSDAFTELFTRYKQPLFGFFWRRVTDRAQAEELTQETFAAVIRAAPRYEASAQFRTYLYAIALKILRALPAQGGISSHVSGHAGGARRAGCGIRTGYAAFDARCDQKTGGRGPRNSVAA